MVVDNYDNENIRNGSLSSNVEMNVPSSSSNVKKSESDVGCEQCGRPSTTECSRCKSVRYCSTKCLITNWRWHKYNCIAGDVNSAQPETPTGNVELLKNSNEEKENIHSPRPLYLELRPGSFIFLLILVLNSKYFLNFLIVLYYLQLQSLSYYY
ncbi:hypothetical protein KIW84_044565 [Lathyrus oleraceus]|nr:hypothetical protein KIW84_044565 [Pisum sativum]